MSEEDLRGGCLPVSSELLNMLLHVTLGRWWRGDLSGGFLRGGPACSFLSSEFNDMLILTCRSIDRSERVRLCSAHAVTASAAPVARAVRRCSLSRLSGRSETSVNSCNSGRYGSSESSSRSESSGRVDTQLLVLRSTRVVGGRWARGDCVGVRGVACWTGRCSFTLIDNYQMDISHL